MDDLIALLREMLDEDEQRERKAAKKKAKKKAKGTDLVTQLFPPTGELSPVVRAELDAMRRIIDTLERQRNCICGHTGHRRDADYMLKQLALLYAARESRQ